MQGYTYQQIMQQLSVSKGTLSGWMRHVSLTNEQEALLRKNIELRRGGARASAAASNRRRRKDREQAVEHRADKSYAEQSSSREFLIGLTLYWAEGTKRDVTWSFINSDPAMIQFMYKWAQRYLQVPPDRIRVRLFIHELYREENLEAFWAILLGIEEMSMQKTIYTPTPHIVKKTPTYKGCIRIYVTGIHHLQTMVFWKDALVNSLNM